MSDGGLRIGIVGAGSLLGKELADELVESALPGADVVLLDEEEAAGQITEAGDEAAVIGRLEADSFERMDFVFFTGERAVTVAEWQRARRAGASIVDMTDALTGEAAVPVRAPWVEGSFSRGGGAKTKFPDLNTPAVVAAHPAALMLALVAARLRGDVPVTSLAATVMEPASQHGRLAMDELHQQTVKLLQFQPLPRDEYDAQVAFNLLPSLGEAAKIDLPATTRRIMAHYDLLSGGRLPELTVQLIHAPVFHGYAVSVLVELGEARELEQLEGALGGLPLDLVGMGSDPPSNLSASGQENILVRIAAAGERPTRFWLWMAADNLKLAARNGIACALELRKLRPQGKVQ